MKRPYYRATTRETEFSFRTAQHLKRRGFPPADPAIVLEQQGCNRVTGWQIEG